MDFTNLNNSNFLISPRNITATRAPGAPLKLDFGLSGVVLLPVRDSYDLGTDTTFLLFRGPRVLQSRCSVIILTDIPGLF
jgi:hypothetical protein